ncbi:hypothetical protein GGR55DRAFT_682493 [Xylaria sp. FL0064]|nr:hypothetical protein GGR55DRAFT_682493 [Xylaria sp. FL0064]
MDPASAVGVAATALQFLDASVKAYNTFQEIKSNPTLSTEQNKQLEDNIRSVQSLRASLAISAPPGTTDPVFELTDKCTSKAERLLTLLQYVRGSGEKIGLAQAFARSVRKRKEIEKLHSYLKDDQVTLNQMIIEKLLPKQDDHHASVTEKLDTIKHDMQLRHQEVHELKRREKLLESLWFPEIEQRQNEIKEPAPSTLGWIFQSETEQDAYIGRPPFSNFRKWLREETSTYWISGKAGSGKSTLMAHIINDQRTHEDLEIWNSGQRLKPLSFFFWRAGSQLQKSVLGLLRSLLYQLCQKPAIADAVLSRLSSPGETMPTWTERSLLSHTAEALRFSKDVRFCIFIDGLDEYTGPYDDLVDHIDKLRASGNVKMCISSRPELELVNRFRDFKQLCLQDLNYGDIRNFVEESLGKVQLTEDLRASLVGDIVWRAEGVFLWASLMTQSLVKGSKLGDSEEMMQERLDSLPKDMNQLFERMLSDVDPVHRKSLAFFVQIMNFGAKYESFRTISIPIIVAAQLSKRIGSYEEFGRECERIEIQITTQSAGLLEIAGSYIDEREEWEVAAFKYVTNQRDFTLNSKTLERRICPDNEPYPVLLDYEYRHMKWIHRSAFEFLSNPNQSPILKSSWSDEQLLQHIGNSWINYIIYAPTYAGAKIGSLMRSRLKTLSTVIGDWYDDYPTIASTLLDSLCSLYAQVCVDELWGATEFDWSTTTPVGKFAFWRHVASLSKLNPYILARMDCISKEPDCDWLIADIFASSIEDIFTRSSTSINRDFVAKFENTLADTLLQCTFHRFEGRRSFRASDYQCISWHGRPLNCAAWRKPATGDSTIVMMRLISIILCYLNQSPYESNLLPTSLCMLMGMADLYISPAVGLDKVHLQLSAKVWTTIIYSMKEENTRRDHDNDGKVVRSQVSAAEIDGAVRVLCVPGLKREEAVSAPRSRTSSLLGWRRPTELRSSEFILLRPSTATSDQLLSQIRYQFYQYNVTFSVTPDRQKLCRLGEMLLKDIKSAEQGLDGGQQLIAAACVRAGFLDLNPEAIVEDLNDSGDDI